MTLTMTDERAEAILGKYEDYQTMEDALFNRDLSEWDHSELVDALAHYWRTHSEDPGFMQPPGTLVREVEDIIGEPIWTDVDEPS